MDYLKSKTVVIKSIGDKSLVIKELSASAQMEFMETFRDEKTRYLAGAVTCKYGVPDWLAMSPHEIASMLSMAQIDEIVTAIQDLGGIAKNSDSTPSDDSSLN